MMNKALKTVFKFIDNVMKDLVPVYAAQASFFLIISFFPLLMLLLSLVKFVVPLNETDILNMISTIVPEQMSNLVITLMHELFNNASAAPLISVTAVTTLWTASKGFNALSLGLNSVYKITELKNYFYRRIVSVVYTLLFIILLILTIVVFGFGSQIEKGLMPTNPIYKILHFILNNKFLIFFILLTLFFTLLYKFLPQERNRFKTQLPGAVISALGWMVFSWGYSVYIDRYTDYSYLYGSLTAVVLLMLWLYICMNIFLYGAEINYGLEMKIYTFGKKNKKDEQI